MLSLWTGAKFQSRFTRCEHKMVYNFNKKGCSLFELISYHPRLFLKYQIRVPQTYGPKECLYFLFPKTLLVQQGNYPTNNTQMPYSVILSYTSSIQGPPSWNQHTSQRQEYLVRDCQQITLDLCQETEHYWTTHQHYYLTPLHAK